MSALGGSPASTWLFQGNPKRFDIDAYLLQNPFIYWGVNRYLSDFRLGDACLIWRAGKNAGLIGVGTLSELPRSITEVSRPESLGRALWKESGDFGNHTKVGIEVREVRLDAQQGFVPRRLLVDHPLLSQSQIIRFRQGSVFRLTESEASVMTEMWIRRVQENTATTSVDDLAVASNSQRNPPWSRDELILALDLYFRVDLSRLSPADPLVIALSRLLNRLHFHSRRPTNALYRNPNGVRMKLMNFLRFDPDYSGKGLSRGGRLEKQVWDEFVENRQALTRAAQSIAAAVESLEAGLNFLDEQDHGEGFAEGGILEVLHRRRERSRKLTERKKLAVLRDTGCLRCEVCGFDFREVYGHLGQGFAECHHRSPLSEISQRRKSRLSDLAIVCANCHRMLHRTRPWRTVEDLKAHLAAPETV